MKLIPLAALTLALPLAVSGCSSSTSLEEQTKLIEYEKCLESAHSFYLLQLDKNRLMGTEAFNYLEERWKESNTIVFDLARDECEKYRP